MSELESCKEKPVVGLMDIFYEHSCGAIDSRDCNAMKHLILAEIRRSNAPSWVAQELEEKLSCWGCWSSMGGRAAAIRISCMGSDISGIDADCTHAAGGLTDGKPPRDMRIVA